MLPPCSAWLRGAPAGRPRRAGRSKSHKACAAEALVQKCRLFCLSVLLAQEGERYPITDAEHELFSPWQHGESIAVAVLSGLKKFRRWNIVSYAMERGIYQ